MARQANSFIENSFTRGLITEATGLNFPEQAVTQTDNCIFDEKGIVRRRPGFDYEYGHEFLDDDDGRVVCCYRWDAAAGNGDNTIIVVQIADTLHFYLTDTGAVSDDYLDSIDLSTFLPSSSTLDIGDNECQFASGKGYLFVSNPAMDSIYVTYDPDMGTVSATEITLEIRDFKGLDDGLGLRERPSTLTEAHEYNLHNQGWNVKDAIDTVGGSSAMPLDYWDTQRSDFPSNTDVWWRFDTPDGYAPGAGDFSSGNTPAPKGHFILNYYSQDPNSVDSEDTDRGWTGLDLIASSGFARASSIEFFAGRVWYAGTASTGFSNEILFSQIIESDEQVGRCYQLNDPTSQDLFDLLPSDGGVISILEAGVIYRLFAYEDSLLVFASNGCWKISGSEGIGFRANDFSVVKVSAIPAFSASSFVSIAGIPSFWNEEGIYAINADQALGTTSINSLTDNTIKEFIDAIPYESRRYVKGTYNRLTRVVTWLYRSTAPTTVRERYTYDRVLCLNTLSKAFYGWSVDITDVQLNGVVVAVSNGVTASPEVVTDSSEDEVTDASSDPVYAFGVSEESIGDVTKYLVSTSDGGSGYKWTFAEPWLSNYVDWFTFDETGTAYSSTFTTGYKVHGEGQRKAQPTYINLFFKTSEEDSSIDFRSIWQYANTGSTGRWSTAQRITTSSNDYDYTRRRIKSRGSGIVYQFMVSSVAGQPFNLIGWSVFETVNASP